MPEKTVKMKPLTPKRLLISRTDNIGDVILTLPMAALIKQYFPNCEIWFLARNYVQSVVNACPDVDRFLSWESLSTLSPREAKNQLKQYDIDTIIHAFPRKDIAKLACRAKIKHRIGTTRRLYHWLYCNHRINFTRAHSDLHEAQLNLKLLNPFNIDDNLTIDQLTNLTHVKPPQQNIDHITALLDQNRFNLVIHPLSNGNGREWPINYYRDLIQMLPEENFKVFITGTAKETELLQQSLLNQCPHAVDLTGKITLDEFLVLLAHCDGLLVGSTGPMHMSAALGTRTLGLFPPQQRLNPKRWGPIGKHAEYIVIDKNCQEKCSNHDCACMRAIQVDKVKTHLLCWIKHLVQEQVN